MVGEYGARSEVMSSVITEIEYDVKVYARRPPPRQHRRPGYESMKGS